MKIPSMKMKINLVYRISSAGVGILVARSVGETWSKRAVRAGRAGEGHPTPLTSVPIKTQRWEAVSPSSAKRIVCAATLNKKWLTITKKCCKLVTKNVCWIAVPLSLLDAVIGSHSLDCSVILDFSIWKSSKLGMHKMELGDSVYAAERIMKKRIRKVSVIIWAGTLDLELRNLHARSHIAADFIG